METTKIVNDPQQLTLFGERTPRAVIYKSESHKLHQAFNVKAGEKIVQGMPVALNEDGLIYPCTDTQRNSESPSTKNVIDNLYRNKIK